MGHGNALGDAVAHGRRQARGHHRRVQTGAVGRAQDRAEDGHPERAPDLAHGHDQGRAHAAALGRERPQRGVHRAGQGEAQPGAHDRHPQSGVAVAAAHGRQGPHEQPRGDQHEPKGHGQLGAHGPGEPVGEHGADHEAADHGQQPQAGAQRIDSDDRLVVGRHREQQAEHGKRHHGGEDRAPGKTARAKQRQVDQRPPGAMARHDALPSCECEQHQDAGDHAKQVERLAPALLPGLDQAVAQHGQPQTRQHDADVVDPGTMGAARFGHEQRHRDQREGDHRHIDEKHGAPPEVGEQPAAEDRPDREGHHRHAEHDGERPLALVLREQDGDHSDRQRQDEGGAEPQKRASGDELQRRGRVGAGQRGHPEQHEGDDQQAFAAVAVAEQAGGQQHGGKNEAVRDDEPLQHVAVCDVQRDGQGRQREVEDREVEPDDEAAHGEGAERPPAAPAGGQGGCIHDRDDLSVVTSY